MLMALVEFCFKSNVEAKRSKTTLSDAMKTKARSGLSVSLKVDLNMRPKSCDFES